MIWKKKNISDVATVTGSYVYTATLFTLLANLASRLIQDFPLAQVGAGLGGGCAGEELSARGWR